MPAKRRPSSAVRRHSRVADDGNPPPKPRPVAEVRRLLKALDTDLLFRLILVLLAYSLVPLAEIFLFLYLADLIGNWLVLMLAAAAGVGGSLVVLEQTRRCVGRLRARIVAGKYPGREFMDLAGLFAAGILLVTPGFATDLLGYLLLIPLFRKRLGMALVRKLGSSFREIYEHLRLSALGP